MEEITGLLWYQTDL